MKKQIGAGPAVALIAVVVLLAAGMLWKSFTAKSTSSGTNPYSSAPGGAGTPGKPPAGAGDYQSHRGGPGGGPPPGYMGGGGAPPGMGGGAPPGMGSGGGR